MRFPLRLSAASAALVAAAAVVPAALRAQAPAVPAAATADAPAVGAQAPDFTMPTAGASGPAGPVSLAALRGKVVVLAFYPKNKTSGCTIQLQKFRDEYAAIFGPKAGRDVVLVPVSADDLASHQAWAGEAKFPFALASDTSLAVAERYGSRRPGAPYSGRTAFVIDRQGRVAYRDLKFNALSEEAYRELAAAVKKAAGA